MPRWNPEAKWKDEDVFIIGGGDSLRNFDWGLLKDKPTIGCNIAFALGKDVCKICIFGDVGFFEKFKIDLEKFEGSVFTNSPQMLHTRVPWIWTMPRRARGLWHDALGWNGNTGASAINLALLLGAKRIFLLGFDMFISKTKKGNWHDKYKVRPRKEVYSKFVQNFDAVLVDWKKKFSDREIINVTDNSALQVFPKIGTDAFWKGKL